MMAYDVLQYLAGLLMIIGSVFALIAAVGLIRLPDVYSRMHAASKTGSVAAGLILIAVALISLDVAVTLRALVAIAFLLLTTPIGAHLLARSCLLAGSPLSEKTVMNEMADELERIRAREQ